MSEKISIRNAPGALRGLYDLVKYIQTTGGVQFQDFRMAEVGSFVGDSTRIWSECAKEVHCVDPWVNGYDDDDAASYTYDMKDVEAQFDELVATCPKQNIVKYKIPSVDGARMFEDGFFDFVYIDGLHTYAGVKDDITAWLPKVKPGMWIGGHDYGHKRAPGVALAVDELLGAPDMRFRETSWVIRLT